MVRTPSVAQQGEKMLLRQRIALNENGSIMQQRGYLFPAFWSSDWSPRFNFSQSVGAAAMVDFIVPLCIQCNCVWTAPSLGFVVEPFFIMDELHVRLIHALTDGIVYCRFLVHIFVNTFFPNISRTILLQQIQRILQQHQTKFHEDEEYCHCSDASDDPASVCE